MHSVAWPHRRETCATTCGATGSGATNGSRDVRAEDRVGIDERVGGQTFLNDALDFAPVAIIEDSAPLEASTAAGPAQLSGPPILAGHSTTVAISGLVVAKAAVSRTFLHGTSPEPSDSGEPRRWNRMALISGVFLVLSAAVLAVSGGVFARHRR